MTEKSNNKHGNMPAEIENLCDLRHQENLLSMLKITDEFFKCKTKRTYEKLINYLVSRLKMYEKFACALVDFCVTESLIKLVDNVVEQTELFSVYVQKIRDNIDLAEKNEKIMNPFTYYSKQFSGSEHSQ